MNYIIGTRGSALALVQSEQVKKILESAYPQDEFTLKVIQTKGDKDQITPLHEIQDKGFFVKELERALQDKTIDLAVHSLKDMPANLPADLCFTNTLVREDARDVLIGKYSSIDELPIHATIATGSKRRKVQLLAWRKDLNIVDIRGNIDTRLRKVEEHQLDGILLAAAGIHRLHLQNKIQAYLPISKMIPSVGQGALAIEIRKEDTALLHNINALCEDTLQCEIDIERSFLKELGGGCKEPMGAYARIQDNEIHLWATYGLEDGSNIVSLYWIRPKAEATNIGILAAKELKQQLEFKDE